MAGPESTRACPGAVSASQAALLQKMAVIASFPGKGNGSCHRVNQVVHKKAPLTRGFLLSQPLYEILCPTYSYRIIV